MPAKKTSKTVAQSSTEMAGAAETIMLPRLEDAVLEIPICGLTPVIPHKWSEKAKRLMPGHPEGEVVKSRKEKRNPEKEAKDSLYELNGRPAIPATAFKAAIIDACRFFSKPSMTEAKMLLFVEGEGPDQLVPFSGTKHLREDTPRNANGNADLRYRYCFSDWSAVLRVRYVPARISRESVIALVDASGRAGVGDWRPSAPKSKTGTYGTYRVDTDKEVRDAH